MTEWQLIAGFAILCLFIWVILRLYAEGLSFAPEAQEGGHAMSHERHNPDPCLRRQPCTEIRTLKAENAALKAELADARTRFVPEMEARWCTNPLCDDYGRMHDGICHSDAVSRAEKTETELAQIKELPPESCPTCGDILHSGPCREFNPGDQEDWDVLPKAVHERYEKAEARVAKLEHHHATKHELCEFKEAP